MELAIVFAMLLAGDETAWLTGLALLFSATRTGKLHLRVFIPADFPGVAKRLARGVARLPRGLNFSTGVPEASRFSLSSSRGSGVSEASDMDEQWLLSSQEASSRLEK